ncbi:hypothetical protein ACFVH0_34565 [Streptomyces sp. NPDC127117]|uniref:hypothetical protein n=1 Tax=Streptomyces sp. NPDC127117 TaxID=3345368 RepID=UPI003638F3C1
MVLDGTDWASLATVRGTGESLPAALERLLAPDPAVREAAASDALREVTHQNTIYEATVPVALYVASVLGHPAISAGNFGHDATTVPPSHPTLVKLLDWLGSTAYDADDECVAMGERHCGADFLQEYGEMRAFRDLRPAMFSAVRRSPRPRQRGRTQRGPGRRHNPLGAPRPPPAPRATARPRPPSTGHQH